MRAALLLLALATACAPVRGDDDDSAGPGSPVAGDLRAVWDGLNPGACAVLPENSGLLNEGAGVATEGLFYEVACYWTGGNASQVTIQPSWFDRVTGGDFPVEAVVPIDPGGRRLAMEGELGMLHVLPSDSGTFNGWWEGDLLGYDSVGNEVPLEAVVFKDAPAESVVGR